ncbi:competence protein ComEA [Deinococcus sp. UYEF24]
MVLARLPGRKATKHTASDWRRARLSSARKNPDAMLGPMQADSSFRLSAALLAAALACGLWALWPVAFPAPRVPTVAHTELPMAQPAAAPEYPATTSITPLVSGQLNLNTATEEQLESLPKVGPAMAARIVAGRPYRSLDDLDAVKGVGPSLMKTLSPLVTF